MVQVQLKKQLFLVRMVLNVVSFSSTMIPLSNLQAKLREAHRTIDDQAAILDLAKLEQEDLEVRHHLKLCPILAVLVHCFCSGRRVIASVTQHFSARV